MNKFEDVINKKYERLAEAGYVQAPQQGSATGQVPGAAAQPAQSAAQPAQQNDPATMLANALKGVSWQNPQAAVATLNNAVKAAGLTKVPAFNQIWQTLGYNPAQADNPFVVPTQQQQVSPVQPNQKAAVGSIT